MFEMTYTCQKEGYFYKRRCAKALQALLKDYKHIELKIRRYEWNYAVEMIKRKGQWFSKSDFMKLDIRAKEKILVTIRGNTYKEEENLALAICKTIDYAER